MADKNNKPIKIKSVDSPASVLEESFKQDGGFSWKKIYAVAGAVLIIGLLATVGFLSFKNIQLAWQVKNLRNQIAASQSPATPIADSVQQVVAAVGKLIILPQNEQPTLATVSDLAKLQGQPFFARAQAGDQVLIYPQAQKAILYRPSENKIIELAPLNIPTNSTSSPSSSAAQTQTLSIEIRNGSGSAGAAVAWKGKLSGNSQFTVKKIGNASSSYPKTLLVDLTRAQKPSLINQLEQFTGASLVQALPNGEKGSTADAVLIIGQQ